MTLLPLPGRRVLAAALLAGAACAHAASSVAGGHRAAVADVSVRVFASATTTYVKGRVVYVVLVANEGTTPASAITLTTTFSARVEVSSATAAPGQCTGPGPVTCTIDTLGRNERSRVRIAVRTAAAGELVTRISATAASPDEDASNNEVSATTVVRPGHAGPPRLRVGGAPLRARPVEDAAALRASLSVDEGATVTLSAIDPRTRRALPLLRGTRVGTTLLTRQRASVVVRIADDAPSLRVSVRLPLRRLKTGRRYLLVVRAVDAENETATLPVPFVLDPLRLQHSGQV